MDSRESRIGDEKGAVSPNVVDFEDPNDPANPMNWSRAFKWLHVALLAWMSFVMYDIYASCAILPSDFVQDAGRDVLCAEPLVSAR